MALKIETDFGKQTKQVGLGKLASQGEKVAEKANTEKPKSPVITLLESLPNDEFESVKKVDTVDTVV